MSNGQSLLLLTGSVIAGAWVIKELAEMLTEQSVERVSNAIRKVDCNSMFHSEQGRTACNGFKIGIEARFQNSQLPVGRR